MERIDQQVSDEGRTPLDAARALSRGNEAPIVSARLISRVAEPLGLDPGEEGPFGDLLGNATRGLADEDTSFADRVDIAIALVSVGVELPEGTLDGVLAAQQPSAGWSADGDQASEAVDVATTGAVVDLLVLAGIRCRERTRARRHRASSPRRQLRSGAWPGVDGEPSAVGHRRCHPGHSGGRPRSRSAPAGSTDLGLEHRPVDAESALIAPPGRRRCTSPVRTPSWPRAGGPRTQRALATPGSGRRTPVGPRASGGLPFEPSLLVLGAIAVIGVGGGIRILRANPAAY